MTLQRCGVCGRVGITEEHLRQLGDVVAQLAQDADRKASRARSAKTFSLALGEAAAYGGMALLIERVLAGEEVGL